MMKKMIIGVMVMVLLAGLAVFGADYGSYKIAEFVLNEVKSEDSFKQYGTEAYVIKEGYCDYTVVTCGKMDDGTTFEIKTSMAKDIKPTVRFGE